MVADSAIDRRPSNFGVLGGHSPASALLGLAGVAAGSGYVRGRRGRQQELKAPSVRRGTLEATGEVRDQLGDN